MWLKAFLLTQALEMPIYLVALLPKRKLWQALIIAFGASALTHPVVWATTGRLMVHLDFWGAVAVTETFAVLAEGLYLHLLGLRRALLWSLAANGFSFGIGLTLL